MGTTEKFAARYYNLIEELISANIKTGFYDGKRGKLAKQFSNGFVPEHLERLFLRDLWATEINSRSNCEKRADIRLKLDELMEEIVAWVKT